jgi:hypothetical protein
VQPGQSQQQSGEFLELIARQVEHLQLL